MSYSIEDRDVSGRKKSAFYSVTASRGAGAEVPQAHENVRSAGFAPEDVKIVRTLLCKHVVAAVYDDAVKRGLMSTRDASVEAKEVLTSYDETLAKILRSQDRSEA